LKIAVTVANPLVKPFRESGKWTFFKTFYFPNISLVRVIDDFAVEKFRQIEAKYPVINTSTKEVMNTLNEKSEPVRHVINTVKGTTTSTIQHGKDTVKQTDISISVFIIIYRY
jgi:hypothetical protein